MKLLYITRKFPPVIGGMEQMNAQLVDQLRRRVELRAITWGRSQAGLPWFVARAAVQALVGQPRPDVICLGDSLLAPLGLFLQKALRRPVATIAHGLDVTLAWPVYQRVVPACLKRLDRVMAVSHFTRQACVERGVPSSRATVIPNGVCPPVDVPPREEARRRWVEYLRCHGVSWDPSSPTLLTAGRLVRRKGVLNFIELILPGLCVEQPGLRYMVIGDGEQRKAIEQALHRLALGDRVHLLGRVDDATLHLAYAACDLFVMPNIIVNGNVEGFGIVALEASAYGLPVIAADLEGIKDVVTEGRNGYRVPWNDSAAYRSVICKCLSDRPVLEALRAGAASYALDFTWERIAERYLEVFRSMALPSG